MAYVLLACIVFSAIKNLDGARILGVFLVPSISHQIVFRPLIQELALRGHEVTVITPDPAFPNGHSPPNLTEIDVRNISYGIWQEELNKVAVGSKTDMASQLEMFVKLYSVILEQQLKIKEIQDIMNKKGHFDLILTEACVKLLLIYSHILKAPVIQISSFGPMVDTNAIIGAPNHPLLYPGILRQRIYNLSWWEKIHAIYEHLRLEYVYYRHEKKDNEMLKRIFGPNTPTLSEMCDNVDMVFMNVHPIWNDNQPVPPGVIYMGGLHQNPPMELPKDLQSYLDSSEHGVIYLSFGTNVDPSILPPEKIKIMTKVFSELPYDIIWKWNAGIPNKPSNIRVFEWLPQSDLLRHPNLKLFITQGGLQSTDEAITAGVPLIGIPVMADQWYNVEKYVRHGIGIQLEIATFTEEEFKNAIIAVIKDTSYRDNIFRLRSLMRDQPQSPLQRAVWWVEHALRHGGARHLRAPAANMTWTRYYQLDLVLIVLACLLSVILVTCVCLYYLQQYIRNNIICKIKLKVV